MAIRDILEIPDKRLKQVSAPVERFNDDLRMLVDDMFETMYDAPGIGLAAIQVGVPLRVLVIDLQERDSDEDKTAEDTEAAEGAADKEPVVKRDPRVFINPEVFEESEEHSIYSEGCLSVPDAFAEVERPARIKARWHDLDGNLHEESMDGLLATCLQHEMDHLEGILFVDRISRLKRQMILKKIEKTRKAA